MNISEVIKPAGARLNLAANSKSELLRILAEESAKSTQLPNNVILDALMAREALGSTGIGKGVALPHAAVAGLGSPFAIAVKLKAPLDFDAIDGLPVDIVVLVLVPDRSGERHVDRLACVARQLRSADVLSRIRGARTIDELYRAFTS